MKTKSGMKYNSIMNTNNLSHACERLGLTITQKLMALECIATEKIHGENFRVGVNDHGDPFIGQRNNIFYLMLDGNDSFVGYDAHPHWNKINDPTKSIIRKIVKYCMDRYNDTGDSFVFFGELCGNGLQSGFKYNWDGLKVLYFDVLYKPSQDDGYYLRHRDAYYWMDYFNVPRVPVVATKKTVSEIMKMDVESMKSEVADSDFIEGIVIKPVDSELAASLWAFNSRFIIKLKTQRYSEQTKRSKRSKRTNITDIDSEFCEFVTIARIEHAIEKINERGEFEVEYQMKDLRFLRNEIITDIEKEENDGNPLTKEDSKALNKYIPKVYSSLLTTRMEELLGL